MMNSSILYQQFLLDHQEPQQQQLQKQMEKVRRLFTIAWLKNNYNYRTQMDNNYINKKSIFNTMHHQSNFKHPNSHSDSITFTNIQPSINLFHMESEQTQQNAVQPALRQKSKSFRMFTKKKTPAQLLTENILKNRKSSRLKNLRQITSQNIKLFVRLQKQRSTYNFKQIHREQSVNLLPSKHQPFTDQNYYEQRTVKSRCSSAGLRIRCQSLKNSLTSSNCTAKNINIPCSSSRKIILISKGQDKQNIGSNKIVTNRQLKTVEEKCIYKKLGLKSSIPHCNLPIPIPNPNKNKGIENKHFKNRPQTCFHQRQDQCQLLNLTQRKLDPNIPQF